MTAMELNENINVLNMQAMTQEEGSPVPKNCQPQLNN